MVSPFVEPYAETVTAHADAAPTVTGLAHETEVVVVVLTMEIGKVFPLGLLLASPP